MLGRYGGTEFEYPFEVGHLPGWGGDEPRDLSGIVVMRHGENAREVIRRVRTTLAEIESSLPEGATISSQKRAALRKRWAHLIRRVYLTDPLICPDCGGELRVIAFITEPKVIKRSCATCGIERRLPALPLLHKLNSVSLPHSSSPP